MFPSHFNIEHSAVTSIVVLLQKKKFAAQQNILSIWSTNYSFCYTKKGPFNGESFTEPVLLIIWLNTGFQMNKREHSSEIAR